MMKTLKNLDEKLIHFDIEAKEEEIKLLPSKRRALLLMVGSAKGKDGEDSLNILQLGFKLRVVGDVQLNDIEFRLLERIINENPLGWPGFIHGQILNYLSERETENDSKKEDK